MIKIVVPATTANVGPGFDTLGLALNMYANFLFELRDDDKIIIDGCEPQYANPKNLVYISYVTAVRKLGFTEKGINIEIQSKIPIARGLGSSSTCVVAGVLAAFALTDTPVDRALAYSIATEIEGHPDNVSPALFGGLTASCTIDGKAYYTKYNIDKRFNFMALIPNYELTTHAARECMPETLPLADVTYSSSRLAMILKAFETYDTKMLHLAMGDKIHEPYRMKKIPEFEEVQQICREIDSICFFISGSGSTLMNVVANPKNAQMIEQKLKSLKYGWKVVNLNIDYLGTRILKF